MKDFVPREQVLKLMKLGFDEECIMKWVWSPINKEYYLSIEWLPTTEKIVLAPTFSQAFRFFREKYGYNCFVTSSVIDGKWYYFRENLNNRKDDSEPELTPKFDTYEEAEIACLIELNELIKTK